MGERRLADYDYDRRPREKKRCKRRKRSKMAVFSTVLLVVAVCVFLFAGYQMVKMLLPYYTGGNEYDKIRDLAIDKGDKDDADGQEEQGDKGFSINFGALIERNADTVAWIRFDEPSIISYPVVKSRDNEEYLTKTFSENDNKLGAIFMDMHNSAVFSDKNTVIYGHHLNVGGEMFSQLNKYADEEFCREYPYFYIYTPDGKMSTYQIFSAGVVKETADNYRVDFGSDEDFLRFLTFCRRSSAYEVAVPLDKDSYIVTLSTCTNQNEDERFIVQGVMISKE